MGKGIVIWKELQHQIDLKGLTIKRGVIQDASFITSDSGHAPADKPQDDQAKIRRSHDGTWAKKERNPIMGIKFTSSWTKIINSSDGSKQPPPQFMIARSISRRKERQFIVIRAILELNQRHPWIRQCIGPFGVNYYPPKRSGETKLSAGQDVC